jgi:hypothetical protein
MISDQSVRLFPDFVEGGSAGPLFVLPEKTLDRDGHI